MEPNGQVLQPVEILFISGRRAPDTPDDMVWGQMVWYGMLWYGMWHGIGMSGVWYGFFIPQYSGIGTELIYHLGIQGTLNQGIDIPYRYPKMGDWSAMPPCHHHHHQSLPPPITATTNHCHHPQPPLYAPTHQQRQAPQTTIGMLTVRIFGQFSFQFSFQFSMENESKIKSKIEESTKMNLHGTFSWKAQFLFHFWVPFFALGFILRFKFEGVDAPGRWHVAFGVRAACFFFHSN